MTVIQAGFEHTIQPRMTWNFPSCLITSAGIMALHHHVWFYVVPKSSKVSCTLGEHPTTVPSGQIGSKQSNSICWTNMTVRCMYPELSQVRQKGNTHFPGSHQVFTAGFHRTCEPRLPMLPCLVGFYFWAWFLVTIMVSLYKPWVDKGGKGHCFWGSQETPHTHLAYINWGNAKSVLLPQHSDIANHWYSVAEAAICSPSSVGMTEGTALLLMNKVRLHQGTLSPERAVLHKCLFFLTLLSGHVYL